MNLRDYQSEAVNSLRRAVSKGSKRPLLQLPTGGGKTHIAMAIIKSAVDKFKKVLFLAPRRELIYQVSEKLTWFGISHGVIMAGEPRNMFTDVQVASMDTLHARAIRSERMNLPEADIVMVDEAHLSIAATRKEIIESYPDAIIIGLTATPARGDGRGLGEIYDNLILSWPIRKLTEAGYLAPVKYYAPSKPDLEGLKLNKDGDYVVRGLGEAVDKPELVGDIVHNWFRIAKDKKTVVFCTTRAHSRHICDEFKSRGIKAEHLDGETPLEKRKAILARVESGETQVLCNVFVATYGLDIPSLECAVLARPTKNIALYLQTVGRVLRINEGKTEAIVIDHSGAVDEHGFVDDFIPWSLDSETSVKERKEQAKKEKQEPKEITCADCGTVFKSSRICPECGHEMIPPSEDVPTHQADLQEIKREQNKLKREMTWEEKINFFGQLKKYCIQTGKREGWAAHKWREKFGTWPNDKRLKEARPVEITPEVAGWITSRNIAYAKRAEA